MCWKCIRIKKKHGKIKGDQMNFFRLNPWKRDKSTRRVQAEKHRQRREGKKKKDKRIEEGQGACLHLEKQKEKEQCYSKDVCLWQGHWVRPCWTKFVRHIYPFGYKIKYIPLPFFENNPSQYLECFLNTDISGYTKCQRLKLHDFILASQAKL